MMAWSDYISLKGSYFPSGITSSNDVSWRAHKPLYFNYYTSTTRLGPSATITTTLKSFSNEKTAIGQPNAGIHLDMEELLSLKKTQLE